MSDETSTFRILSSGRRLETNPSVQRVLSSGRRVDSDEQPAKKQRLSSTIASTIEIAERKTRENEPSKKLLLQAVSDANKSVLMKLNKANGIVKVMNPDGSTECLTTRTLARRLKAKEPTWIDPSSLIEKSEPSLGKMKIRVRNEFCTSNEDSKSSDPPSSSAMEFEDDEEDEFVVVVNNDYEAADESNNIWMLNDYPYQDDDNGQNYEENRGNGSFKRKLSDDHMSDDIDQQQYSPPANPPVPPGKKMKRCRFWPDCHAGEQCEFVHPTQRCTHFPNCAYGSECLYIHPNCRFGSACIRSDCPYVHSSSTPASSPSSTNNSTSTATTGRASIPNRAESATICKFGLQCMRPNCVYTHPRVPIVPARNLKWVNNKWRAPDDTPLLPPTPKNIVHEYPFNTDKSKVKNSNETESTN